MADPADIGARVLAALQAGRAVAIAQAREQASHNERAVRRLLDLDIMNGKASRGRAGRIARALHGQLSSRGVAKILERLSSRSDSVCSNGDNQPMETPE